MLLVDRFVLNLWGRGWFSGFGWLLWVVGVW